MVALGDLSGGTLQSDAFGISFDGSVVVGMGNSASGNEAFRWTSGGGMVGLGDLPAGIFDSRALNVSADGLVIVGRSESALGDDEAFRWTAADGMVGLGDLAGGAFDSVALGLSADGSVIVGRGVSASGGEAFRWTAAAGVVGLGALTEGNFYSEARDASADGSVIVGSTGATRSDLEPFIWDAVKGMRSLQDQLVDVYGLDLSGWELLEARGISDDGRTITGFGTNPSGDREAWIATIPEPSTALLLALGLVGIAAGRRRYARRERPGRPMRVPRALSPT
jgi:probable HAF family extracellular repeat protein